MNDIPANLNAEIPSNGTWLRISWIGLAQHHSACLHHIEPLPYHGHHRPLVHVLHQPWEERTVFQVNVVLLQVFLRSPKELHGHQVEALLLEALDDLSRQATLHAIWLGGNAGMLEVGHGLKVSWLDSRCGQ